MEVVYLLVGLLLGTGVGWFISRSSGHSATVLAAAEQERTKSVHAQLLELKQELEAARLRILELTASLSVTEADYRNLEEKFTEKLGQRKDSVTRRSTILHLNQYRPDRRPKVPPPSVTFHPRRAAVGKTHAAPSSVLDARDFHVARQLQLGERIAVHFVRHRLPART